MEKTNNVTAFSDLDNKQKAEKIGKIALRVTIFLAKWALFICVGLFIGFVILVVQLALSIFGMDKASQQQRERNSLAREIAKNIKLPRY